ncbi:hypothetical protein [Halomonas nitroreducens]|uniref:Uncharacterized protein n=1 Tax=Halomonas nitroreducens TaxID=447425 RepID=A0A431V709_9GAMM|nr:hypothetical protein [Halomonas nitroreducens]RTR05589.1 hypothetical protein EKG36_05705 [Halomonas nitroreducens]
MRSFLFPRHPLPRRTLLFCHAVLQVGLLAAGGLWLASQSPWLADTDWLTAAPRLALGGSALLLAMIGLRLLAELWLLPYHLADQRTGFAPAAVVTRSFERRPAVHAAEQVWTSAAQPMEAEDTVLGSARVTRAAPRRPRAQDEPTLDLAGGQAEPVPEREPRL